MSALEDAGRLPGSAYKGATMYTTLSPCDMCTGACVMYGVKRVVIGENQNFKGGEDYLASRGIEVVNVNDEKLVKMMAKYIEENPQDWYFPCGCLTPYDADTVQVRGYRAAATMTLTGH